ncbi:MAG: hypothetical protein P8Z75_07380 [Gammaproteobacteria bacterium]|jgi:hypothetical protein
MPYVVVIVLAALSCVFGYHLPYFKAQDFYGVLLVMVAGVYVGLALADGRRSLLILELLAALGFCAVVLLGMWWKDIVLVYAFFLQAIWHLVHFQYRRIFRVKTWYPLTGMLYDGIVGAFVYFHLYH